LVVSPLGVLTMPTMLTGVPAIVMVSPTARSLSLAWSALTRATAAVASSR
jgi:hypothetical protein